MISIINNDHILNLNLKLSFILRTIKNNHKNDWDGIRYKFREFETHPHALYTRSARVYGEIFFSNNNLLTIYHYI